MYSRRMLPWADIEGPEHPWGERFEHLLVEIEREFPPATLVLGELVAYRDEDDKRRVNSLTKSKTERALQIQEEGGWAYYYIWNVAFYEGKDVLSSTPTRELLELACRLAEGKRFILPPDIYEVEDFEVLPQEVVSDILRLEAERLGWEGWVIVDPDGVMGDRAWNLRGKAERSSKVSCKCKPFFECDAIAYWDPEKGIGEYGTGRHQGHVKSLALFQYDGHGELIQIGKVGSGLTDKMKEELADPKLYPIVVEVRYDARYYKSKGYPNNSLYIPRFIRIREDKSPEECWDDDL